jgi:hypothetical protein
MLKRTGSTIKMQSRHFLCAIGLSLASVIPTGANAEILWTGDFETGHLLQWHHPTNKIEAWYWGIPPYGRPARHPSETSSLSASYYGDGSLAAIVTSPVRQGRYAAKFTVKNSANGVEPADCDVGSCERRRAELWANKTLSDSYNAVPYMKERWISASVFVPADWESAGSGWGPIVFQMKPRNESGISPTIAIELKSHGWEVIHRWAAKQDPAPSDVPWQQHMAYSSVYPTNTNWPDGLKDFPDTVKSQASLAAINKGGWTDWVINLRSDARGVQEGGTGYLRMWKRSGSGSWVEVLHIKPKKTTRGGLSFDHGVMYNSPAGSNNGGFGVQVGLYMDKNQVWGLSRNRVIVIDNVKVGNEKTQFSMMSPDGSSPDSTIASPQPPAEVAVR